MSEQPAAETMPSVTVFGIRNCGTMKKAFEWLDAHGVPYLFHDFKRQGLEEEQLRTWVDDLGWEALINRRGQTWRRLDEATRNDMDNDLAIQVMRKHPSIIRRPLLAKDSRFYLGFSEDLYAALFDR